MVSAEAEHVDNDFFNLILDRANFPAEDSDFLTKLSNLSGERVNLPADSGYLGESTFPDGLRVGGALFRLGLQSFDACVQIPKARVYGVEPGEDALLEGARVRQIPGVFVTHGGIMNPGGFRFKGHGAARVFPARARSRYTRQRLSREKAHDEVGENF